MTTRNDRTRELSRVGQLFLLGALWAAAAGCSGASPTDGAGEPATPGATDADTNGPDDSDARTDGGRTADAASTAARRDASLSTAGDTGPGASRPSDAGTLPSGSSAGDAGSNAGAGTSGSGSTADAGGDDDCVEGPSAGDAGAAHGAASGNGQVFFYSPTGNPITRLRTKLTVPKPPTKNGVLFLWPGLQPTENSRNFNPIGTGVLQPVLTWGASCAPNHLGETYDSWWISAQYVNTIGKQQGYTGCHGGESMKVAVGDVLNIDMSLSGTRWAQTVTDEQTGKTVDFDFDLMGQDQNWALFVIEDTYASPSEDVIFRSSVLTYATAAPSACAVGSRGTNDYVTTPRPLKAGLECCIPRIVLRARGVAASSPN